MSYTVYTLLAANDVVLYVGCTARLSNRLSNHRSKKWWFADVAAIRCEEFADRDDALARERALIGYLGPLHNVDYNPNAPQPLPAPPASLIPPRCESGCDCPTARRFTAWARADYAVATGQRLKSEYASGEPIPTGVSIFEDAA